MYLRFRVDVRDASSGQPSGVFSAVYDLIDSDLLPQQDLDVAKSCLDWFDTNLKEPASFSKSTKPHAQKVGISWFKDSATEHISKMRMLVALLEDNSVSVKLLITDNPGYILYEDDYQVVSDPHPNTPT